MRQYFKFQCDYYPSLTQDVIDRVEFKTVWSGKRMNVGDNMSNVKVKILRGVGINDVNYIVKKSVTIGHGNKKRKQVLVWVCPYYQKWHNMLVRCYCKKYQARHPTYIDCSVDPDWLYLSNFIKWVDSQPNRDWQNCSLDKDFLSEGNKHYSPDTCVFISKNLNPFIINRCADRAEYLLGVCLHKPTGKFRAGCSDPFKVNSGHVGLFNTELEAHLAWQAKKHEYACQLADLQSDERVAEVLRTKYAPDKDWRI
jgi:hypothetical protein